MDKRELREERRALREEARSNRRRRIEQKVSEYLSRRVPPGLDWEKEFSWVRGALICTAVFGTLVFVISCINAVSGLYEYKWEVTTGDAYTAAGRVLKEGAVMPAINVLLEHTRIGYALVGLLLVILLVSHYRYYRQGSMSIYVMRRLPDKGEYHRRNLTFPLILVGLALAVMMVTALVHYGLYLLFTPKGCLPNGHWMSFWLWMIGGGL